MDSSNDHEISFTISSNETLLKNQQPKHKINKSKGRKTKIFFSSFLILIFLVSSTMILSTICTKNTTISRLTNYLSTSFNLKKHHQSASNKYYCHLTRYPQLCYVSISSIINTTLVETNPGLIFPGSIRVIINELGNITISIAKAAMPSTISTNKNSSLVRSRMSDCGKWVDGSLSQLKRMMGDDSDVESLTYFEIENMKEWVMVATSNAVKCLRALEEVDVVLESTGDEERGRVEEVKLGLVKARKYMINSIGLLSGRDYILGDFYTPFGGTDDFYYDYVCHGFGNSTLLVFMYYVLYLFIALLYFLFWNSE